VIPCLRFLASWFITSEAGGAVGDVSLTGGEAMNVWWWLPIGLAAWFALAVVVSLLLGPVLRRSSQTREALDRQAEQQPAKRTEPPRHRKQAS
jgi:hypothetical protein